MATSQIFRRQHIPYFFAAIVTAALVLSACKGDIETKMKLPALSLLPGANQIYLQIDCNDPKSKKIAHYFLQRGANDFSGQVHYTIDPGQENSCSNIGVEKRVIPRETAQDFLEMLSKSAPVEGGGVSGATGSDVCPSVRIEIGADPDRVVFFATAKEVNRSPWGVVIHGKTYTADASVPAEALAALDPYLSPESAGSRGGVPGAPESVSLGFSGESSAESVALFVDALRDRDKFVRDCAVSALGRQKDERAFIPLSALLSDTDGEVRKAAAQAMRLVMIGSPAGKYGKEAVVPLIGMLKEKDADVRKTAVEILGGLQDARAVDPLIEALKDEDKYVRRNAAAALGQLKDDRAAEPLIAALKDEDLYVRRQAAFALWGITDERAVKPLISALTDKDKMVVGNAAIALARAGDKRAVEPLMKNLRNKDAYVRRNAATALGLLKDKRAVKSLIDAMTDKDRQVRQAAASALGKMKDNFAVNPLIKALKDEDIYVRRNAAIALGRIEDKRAVKPLITVLTDRDKEVRKAAASALGEIQDSRASEALIDVSNHDEDDGVRNSAASALERIKKPS